MKTIYSLSLTLLILSCDFNPKYTQMELEAPIYPLVGFEKTAITDTFVLPKKENSFYNLQVDTTKANLTISFDILCSLDCQIKGQIKRLYNEGMLCDTIYLCYSLKERISKDMPNGMNKYVMTRLTYQITDKLSYINSKYIPLADKSF